MYDPPSRDEILHRLRETDPTALEGLWRRADEVRRAFVGDEVHLRGLVEISNHCVRRCAYCGISARNAGLARYRMSAGEIIDCAHRAVAFGYGTVVLQSGEDYGIETDWMAHLIRSIKESTPLAVTLSLGERPETDLDAWREAGADRYLLRFETSDKDLYRMIHPDRDGVISDRLAGLAALRRLGYEIGGGVIVGLPGQSFESLADDVAVFGELDLDMVGLGPYIPHPATPLGRGWRPRLLDSASQVPNDEPTTYKVLALTRLVCPEANIPSTTALATINTASGRELGLQRGANVVMPNLTPARYRRLYEIYPGKACFREEEEQFHRLLLLKLEELGRRPGSGQGGRRRTLQQKSS